MLTFLFIVTGSLIETSRIKRKMRLGNESRPCAGLWFELKIPRVSVWHNDLSETCEAPTSFNAVFKILARQTSGSFYLLMGWLRLLWCSGIRRRPDKMPDGQQVVIGQAGEHRHPLIDPAAFLYNGRK